MLVCSNQSRFCARERTVRGTKAMVLKKRLKARLTMIISERGQKRRRMEKINATVARLKWEMKEISEEQNSIKEGQRQVKEKFEDIMSECEKLRHETELITRQSICTKLRLTLMFQILKARENNDFAKAAELTTSLREMIAQQKDQNLESQQSGGATGEARHK